MKNKRPKKNQDLDRDQALNEEERHRRLWLQHALQTPMPWPREPPSIINVKKNSHGKDS
jgi:hypothetical protein